ncbi:DUF4290 domain-containing protein [Lewinella sp. 4G2]|uniref:DUF4290 domain-containing protein n=1 Tax=Lewinella sp. 4G2 TaxID=1803372 RepID=UPI0007B4DAD3|nr:DUF4290 domain-containing protein [Lewinella sp. 4G2]OAV46230.1 hypothetical protein A3850_018415 [Lewinella sp. 4G2]
MEWDIAYNTTQAQLINSEYGRGVQDLLRKANAVEDDAERQQYVERVIQLMLQMQPDIKTQENYIERLWRHAFVIAGEPLNVEIPEGITIEEEAEKERPTPLPYPDQAKTRMRHYGQNVQQLIKAAVALEEGPQRDAATYTAAYYMKVALDTWDQGKFVNEEVIRKDLYEMSEKQLVLAPDVKIGTPGPNQPDQNINLRKRKKKNKRNNQQKKQKPSAYGNGGSKNKRRNKRRR